MQWMDHGVEERIENEQERWTGQDGRPEERRKVESKYKEIKI